MDRYEVCDFLLDAKKKAVSLFQSVYLFFQCTTAVRRLAKFYSICQDPDTVPWLHEVFALQMMILRCICTFSAMEKYSTTKYDHQDQSSIHTKKLNRCQQNLIPFYHKGRGKDTELKTPSSIFSFNSAVLFRWLLYGLQLGCQVGTTKFKS